MNQSAARFLTAEWRNLALLNFEIDPEVLAPYVPLGTELDKWRGRTFVSLVGFQFLALRVWGVAIPFHQDFDEVNLRFYVRRQTPDGWRRGVAFIRELAPRRAVAWTARVLFGENYLTVPMRHDIESPNGDPHALRRVGYAWRHARRQQCLQVAIQGNGQPVEKESLEEFIIEHYWGYSGGRNRPTIEYRVDHPRWKIWPACEARFDVVAAELYGERFVETLSAAPASAFLADGSPVTLYRGIRIG